jgi:hypothetical protein
MDAISVLISVAAKASVAEHPLVLTSYSGVISTLFWVYHGLDNEDNHTPASLVQTRQGERQAATLSARNLPENQNCTLSGVSLP